jgi:hypothetical protein
MIFKDRNSKTSKIFPVARLSQFFHSFRGEKEEREVLGQAGGLKNSRYLSSSKKKATSPPRRRITEE